MWKCLVTMVVSACLCSVGTAEPIPTTPVGSREYVIELRMLQGDPLGDEAAGNLKVLMSPSLVVGDNPEGWVSVQSGYDVKDGQKETKIAFEIRVTAHQQKDGSILVQLACEKSEEPKQSSDSELDSRHEVHTITTKRRVHHGDVFKVRLETTSATQQTWIEATLTEIKFADRNR